MGRGDFYFTQSMLCAQFNLLAYFWGIKGHKSRAANYLTYFIWETNNRKKLEIRQYISKKNNKKTPRQTHTKMPQFLKEQKDKKLNEILLKLNFLLVLPFFISCKIALIENCNLGNKNKCKYISYRHESVFFKNQYLIKNIWSFET